MTALIPAVARGRTASAPPAQDPVQYLTFKAGGSVL